MSNSAIFRADLSPAKPYMNVCAGVGGGQSQCIKFANVIDAAGSSYPSPLGNPNSKKRSKCLKSQLMTKNSPKSQKKCPFDQN